MSCQVVSHWLLGSDRPDRPPVGVARHLANCAPCRSQQRRLLRLERQAARLPVPASAAKAAFLEAFVAGTLHADPADLGPATRIETWKLHRVAAVLRTTLQVPQQKLHIVPAAARRRLAAALTAALLFLAIGLWANGPNSPLIPPPIRERPSPDALLADLVRGHDRLAVARTAQERVETLADMADSLNERSRALAQDADLKDLGWLAEKYQQVVAGLVTSARALPEGQGRLMEDVAQRLDHASQDADELATRLAAQNGRREPLLAIAASARDGGQSLRSLRQGGKL